MSCVKFSKMGQRYWVRKIEKHETEERRSFKVVWEDLGSCLSDEVEMERGVRPPPMKLIKNVDSNARYPTCLRNSDII